MTPTDLERAQAILEELDVDTPGLLERWVAQYISDLLDKQEAATDATERQAVEERIREAISTIWKVMIERERQRLERPAYGFTSSIGVEAGVRFAELLADRDRLTSDPAGCFEILKALPAVDRFLLGLAASLMGVNTKPGPLRVVVITGLGEEDVTPTVIRTLAPVLPTLDGIDLSEPSSVAEILSALESVGEIRTEMLRNLGALGSSP